MIDTDPGTPAATTPTTEPPTPVKRADRRPAAVLAVLLAVAVPIIVTSRAADPWFIGDDWGLLVGRSMTRPGDWFRPQNGHWSTVPLLVYHGLYSVVGLRHYWVFRAAVALIHVAIVVLTWHLVRRLVSSPWLALLTVMPLILMGAAPTNLVSPIQVSQSGSIAFGLAMLLLVDHDGRLDRRDGAAVGLGLLSLASSGMGPIIVLVVGMFALLRRGVRVAAVLMSILMGTYVLWWKVAGGASATGSELDPVMMLRWIYQGMTATFSLPTQHSLSGLALAGIIVAGMVRLVLTRGWPTFRGTDGLLPALIAGALLNFAAVSTQRWFLGPDYARADRYVYVAVVLLLPVMAVAFQQLAGSRWWLAVLLALPLLLGMPPNVARLFREPTFQFQSVETLFTGAVADPLATQVSPDLVLKPDTFTGREVTIGWLLAAKRENKLPPPPTLSQEQRDEIDMRLSISRQTIEPTPTTSCEERTGPARLDLRRGDVVRVAQSVTLAEVVDGQPGTAVPYQIDALFSPADHLVVEVPSITVDVDVPGDTPFTICR